MPKYEAVHEIIRAVKGKLETIEPSKIFEASEEEVASYPAGSYRELGNVAPSSKKAAADQAAADKKDEV